ncbi:MAG: arsenite methyltransferase [Chloroflexi bacterium]|nr:arsenite methyltransferase [Chloroflexota bacterium]
MQHDPKAIREAVRAKYATAALRVAQSGTAACCGSSPGSETITRGHYSAEDAAALPQEALLASLGCGNPTLLAELYPGETVLDLGSGGGVDVLLSARRVGTSGLAYGLDMTDEMLALAEENRRKTGLENVRFLKGYMEQVPLPDASVDVIISNCVVNLSPDKDAVLRESWRVLRPGGRFAVSDIVLRAPLPPAVHTRLEMWAGCVAGALTEADYRAKLAAAGFEGVEIVTTRIYGAEVFGAESPRWWRELDDADRAAAADCVTSAFVRAWKPGGAAVERRPAMAAVPVIAGDEQRGCCGGVSSTCC